MTQITIDLSKIKNRNEGNWQKSGTKFVKQCEAMLWKSTGANALKYLHSLGLKDETLRKYRIGFHHIDKFDSLEEWGLPIEFSNNGNPKKIWLPRGIVVPTFFQDTLWSVKIRRYLTEKQKSRGEQSDQFIKGSTPGLYGVENLKCSSLAFITDDEFEAMVIDQEVDDLVGAASFGRPVKYMNPQTWIDWGRYFLPISGILIPYNPDDEWLVITNALPGISDRIYRAHLPESPRVKKITDFKQADIEPKKWLLQMMSDQDLQTNIPTHPKCSVTTASVDSDLSSLKDAAPSNSLAINNKVSTNEVSSTHHWVTYKFDAPWIVDPTIMPSSPCYCCNRDEYWQRPDGGWVCNICHPRARPTII